MRTDKIKLFDHLGNLMRHVSESEAWKLINTSSANEIYSPRRYGISRADRFIGIQMRAPDPANPNISPCTLTFADSQANAGVAEMNQIKRAQTKVAFWPFASENNKSITVVPRFYEVKMCECCPRNFTRRIGTLVKYCIYCAAEFELKQKANPYRANVELNPKYGGRGESPEQQSRFLHGGERLC